MTDTRHEGPQMQVGSVRPGLFENSCVDPITNIRPNTALMVKQLRDSHRSQTTSPGGASKSLNSTQPHRSTTPSSKKSHPGLGMMEGMEMGTTSDPAYPGILTLENINAEQGYHPGTLLNSPRSVQACVNLGLVPRDFLRKTQQEFVKDLLEERGPKDDEDIIKMRVRYHDQRRKQKMEQAKAERLRLVRIDDDAMRALEGPQSDAGLSSQGCGQDDDGDKAEMVRKEEAKLNKIIAASESRYKQQLLHMEIGRSRRTEREAMVNEQNAREAARQEDIRNAQVSNDKLGEEEQERRNKMRELERRQQQAEMEKKLESYEKKEKIVQERIKVQRKETEESNMRKKERNDIRQKMMQHQAIEIQIAKRKGFDERWIVFQDSMEAFRQKLVQTHEEKRIEAEEKQSQITKAVERAKMILENQTRQTLMKELQAEDRVTVFHKNRMEFMEEKRVADTTKELKRQHIFDDAMLMQRERVARLKHKMLVSDKHMEHVSNRREKDRKEYHEKEREKQLDKMGNVERMKRLQERERQRLLDKIHHKDHRVKTMKEQQSDIMAKRKMHRMKVEAMRISFQEATPGPGEYTVDVGVVGPHSPQWKFGLPASVQTMRVISNQHAPVGQQLSPGPAAYSSANALDKALHHAPVFSVARADRFPNRVKSPIEVTPGPGEYTM